MKRKLFAPVLILALLFGGCEKEDEQLDIQEDPLAELKHGDPIPGKYIVVYKDLPGLKSALTGTYDDRVSVMRSYSEQIFSETGLSEASIEHAYIGTIHGVSARLGDTDVNELQRDDRIAFIEPDRIVIMRPPWERDPEPDPGDGDDGGTSTQVVPWGITRVNGAVSYTGSNRAWVIDTGVEFSHPDLNVNTVLSKTFIARGPDSNNASDLNGHGTHVAGTIAAIDNDFGVVGVAAGAEVVAVKVLDRRGSGAYSDVIAGVDYVGATASSGDVANMSLGGPVSDALDDAVLAASNKGIRFAIAAGNSGADANNYSPARVNGQYIYSISAMDSNDVFASFSNWGNPPVDYCAPGVSINSTWINEGYNTISGTSMAAPHAAGILLIGSPKTDGNVNNDPDGDPDPIIVH